MDLFNFSTRNLWKPAGLTLLIAAFLLAGSAPVWAVGQPAPDPPYQSLGPDEPDDLGQGDFGVNATPTTEWVWHKTADSAHPDGNEQQMVWLMNRARSDPGAEGLWLATSTDPDIASSRNYFGVNTSVLQSEFNSYSAKLPAAFDRRLYEAAISHSQYLASTGSQTHNGQFDRVNQAGFSYTTIRGNVFAYADSALNAHAGFNIDWGNDANGMQSERGHRKAIMALDGNYTNVGLAVYQYSGNGVGPYVVTGNYAHAAGANDHANTFIVGTVWEDANGNGIYDPGEGKSGVQVMPNQGTYYAVTAAGGGYAIPTPNAGTYTLTFSGGQLSGTVTKTVDVVNQSVLCDVTGSGSGGDGGDGGNGDDGTGQYNFVDDFTATWNMNHSGWLGTLTLGQAASPSQSKGNMSVNYVGSDGSPFTGYGFVRTPNYPRDASWGPDNQIEFYIDFKNDNGDTKFMGYIFSWNKEAIAGVTWWHNTPFGFYCLRGAGGSSLHMGDHSISAYTIGDFIGTYEMNHDSWTGRLDLYMAPQYIGVSDPPDITGYYTSHNDGKVHEVRGYTNVYGNRDASWGPTHQMIFYIDFDDTTSNWDDDQRFVGYLFSPGGPMAGICYWHDRPFGFYALR